MACENCVNEYRIVALETERDRMIEQLKDFHEKIFAMSINNARTEEQYNNIATKLDDISGRLTKMESKSGKLWENISEKVIYLVIAAVIGFVMGKIFI